MTTSRQSPSALPRPAAPRASVRRPGSIALRHPPLPVRAGLLTLLPLLALLTLAGLASVQPARAQPLRSQPAALSAPAGTVEARFDLAVNNAPAAQVFQQLAQLGGWQMLLSPELSGQISLTLKDTTATEALDALRELYGYDLKVQGRRLTVLPNGIQTRLFQVSYLPGRRQGASDLRVSAASISNAGGSGSTGSGSNGYGSGNGNPGNGNNSSGNTGNSGNGGNNGNAGAGLRGEDSAYVRTSSDADFWRDVKASLQALLGLGEVAEPAQPGAAAAGVRRSLVINAAAGVIVVRATPTELHQVEAYLQAVQVSIERQVMLEAKIVDVELAAGAQTGINWATFGRTLGGAVSIGMVQPGVTLGNANNLPASVTSTYSNAGAGTQLAAAGGGAPFYGLSLQTSGFGALLSFLESQGKVQVLSSPRIATLNNQKAVLKVGSDELYVTGVASTTTATGSTSTTTPSVILQPFFSGIALDVTPQIAADGQVMLHVHPAISTVAEKQKNINLGALGSYQLPLASSTINETDSIVRVQDGQIVAIGGLMSQERHEDRSGLPVLGDLPVVGHLFSQKVLSKRKRELVILIKPTIIQSGGAWPEGDGREPATRLQPFEPGVAEDFKAGVSLQGRSEPASAAPVARPQVRIEGPATTPAGPTAAPPALPPAAPAPRD